MTLWINTGLIDPKFSELAYTIDPSNPLFIIVNYFEINDNYTRNKIKLKEIESRTREFMNVEINTALKQNNNVFLIDEHKMVNYWTDKFNNIFSVKYVYFICNCNCKNKNIKLQTLNKKIPIKKITCL